MLDLNRNKYINGLCAVVFFLAACMFVVGAFNQSIKDVLLGLGLMCITFVSLVGLFKKLKRDHTDLIGEAETQSYDRLSLLGLILVIIGIVFF